jgi:quercetin dioxygenase-like cupin family protein
MGNQAKDLGHADTSAGVTIQRLFTVMDNQVREAPEIHSWAPMHKSDAVGVDILYDVSHQAPFGLGLIRFPPRGEVTLHVHEGSHILVCFRGGGLVNVVEQLSRGKSRIVTNTLTPGECYCIPSMVPHSVHAGPEGLLLMVVGNDYRCASSEDRLQMVNG